MKFIKKISLCIVITAYSLTASSQNISGQDESMKNMHEATLKLIEYYQTYDTLSPETERRQAFDNFYNTISGGSASQTDKDLAYKLVNAYITAENDYTPVTADNQNLTLDEFIKNNEEFQKAEKAINDGYQNFMSSSYEDFEKYIRLTNPAKSRREIKTMYNQIHQNDGKQVSITPADDELTPEQQMLWAIEAIENPKNYEEFEKAAKILNPKIKQEKIQEAWEKFKTSNK